jgi:hypothetical protein
MACFIPQALTKAYIFLFVAVYVTPVKLLNVDRVAAEHVFEDAEAEFGRNTKQRRDCEVIFCSFGEIKSVWPVLIGIGERHTSSF